MPFSQHLGSHAELSLHTEALLTHLGSSTSRRAALQHGHSAHPTWVVTPCVRQLFPMGYPAYPAEAPTYHN